MDLLGKVRKAVAGMFRQMKTPKASAPGEGMRGEAPPPGDIVPPQGGTGAVPARRLPVGTVVQRIG